MALGHVLRDVDREAWDLLVAEGRKQGYTVEAAPGHSHAPTFLGLQVRGSLYVPRGTFLHVRSANVLLVGLEATVRGRLACKRWIRAELWRRRMERWR